MAVNEEQSRLSERERQVVDLYKKRLEIAISKIIRAKANYSGVELTAIDVIVLEVTLSALTRKD